MPASLPRALRSLCLIAVLALSAPGAAQAAGLEAQRDAVFRQMLVAPDDRGLMRDYARLSVLLRDYEAAVSTLERALQLDPTDGTARYELAIAYQALGATEMAAYHFARVTPTDSATADELAAYQRENTTARSPSRFSGQVAAGAIHRAGTTRPIVRARLVWQQDLGGSNRDYWQTDLSLAILGRNGALSDRQSLALRSGPWLTLGDSAYGARLRPYVEARLERDSAGTNRRIGFVGVQYDNTHTRELSSFADLRAGRVLRSGAARNVARALAGLSYRPTRDSLLRAAVRVEREWSTGSRILTRGARLDAVHQFSVGEMPRKWAASAHIQADWLRETGADPRNERLQAAGIGLRAYATREVFVDLGARAERRHSDVAGRDQRNTVFTVQIGREF